MGIVKVGLIVLVISNCILAATIRVPQDQPTIQAGIDVAVDGDTVLVGPGVYQENISFNGRAISLVSLNGPDSTILEQGSAGSPIVLFNSGEDTTSVLDGFMVRNAVNAHGILIEYSSPIVQNCVVSGCSWEGDGGAIRFVYSAAKIRNNRIHSNYGTVTGGGIGGYGTTSRYLEIIGNIIYSNHSPNGVGIGGTPGGLRARIERNLIYDNEGDGHVAAGIYVYMCDDCQVLNNTVVRNTKGISIYGGSANVQNNIVCSNLLEAFYPTLLGDFNDVWSNGSANYTGPNGISADPRFVSPTSDDFSLQFDSPCINRGNPDPSYNDPDGSRNDIGAFPYEPVSGRIRYVPSEYSTIQSAIDSCVDGDTVLVADGHYYERISFLGKNITTASYVLVDGDTSHVSLTIIDGDTSRVPMVADTGCVVRFVNGEDSRAKLIGLTIQNSAGIGALGSGVLCRFIPTIDLVRVRWNASAGLYFSGSTTLGQTPVVSNCEVVSNGGSGIYCYHETGITIKNTIISDNSRFGIEAYWWESIEGCRIERNAGGGVQLTYPPYKTTHEKPLYRHIGNSVIKDNYFGIHLVLDVRCDIDSCLIEGNHLYGVMIATDVVATISNSVFKGNGCDSSFGGGLTFRENDNVRGVTCTNTLFESNKAARGGAIFQPVNVTERILMQNCTFVGNVSQFGSVFFQEYRVRWWNRVTFENCVFAWNKGNSLVDRAPSPDTSQWTDSLRANFVCIDSYGNEGGDWSGYMQPFLDSTGNFSADPLFCDSGSGIFSIRNSSPCAPENSSCAVLIGAYRVGCENAPPVLTSGSDTTIVKRVPFTYIATSEDSDGPNASYSFLNLPSWLESADDSCFGTPQLDECDTTFTIIVSDGFLADSMVVTLHLLETPVIAGIAINGESEPLHVVSAAPMIAWDYSDTTGLYPQTALEIAVGTDNNWQYAEMWNPAPFASADTFVAYGGAPLIDGQTYWLRLRVSNSLGWSNWSELMFHMNSVPSAPELAAPANSGIVTNQQPSLSIRRVSDAEGDSLLLTFEIANDSLFSFFVPFTTQPSTDSLTTVNVPFYLTENQRYWWRVKASDYYEESAYSAIWSFWINRENSAPTAFDLLTPVNSFEPALATTTPLLEWTQSNDIDPFDQVSYAVHLAIDSSFGFASITSGIDGTSWQPSDPLNWGTKYWWTVKATDLSTGVTWSNQVYRFRTMRPGDPDGNGIVTISDAVFLISYIFAGGPAPNPLPSGDADCTGSITISDAVYLINYIFGGGPAPCEEMQ